MFHSIEKIKNILRQNRYDRFLIWKNGIVFMAIFVVLPLCLSGSCKLPAIEFSAGQTAFAATGETAQAGMEELLRVADMEPAEKERYSQRIRKYVLNDPSFLLKLKEQDMPILFQKPDLIRREGQILTRQYRTESCLVDVYLSQKAQQDESQAAIIHYEVRTPHVARLQYEGKENAGNNNGTVDQADCLRQMVEAGEQYMVATR